MFIKSVNESLSVGTHVYVGALSSFQVWVAAKSSIGIVIMGVFSCTRLADVACWCGLRLALIFGQGSNFATSRVHGHLHLHVKKF